MLLQHITAFLETVDQYACLSSIIKVIAEINGNFQPLLLQSFVKVVDSLIGWSTKSKIDFATLYEIMFISKLIRFRCLIYDLLFKFNDLWKQNTVYSLRLINSAAYVNLLE